MNLYTIICNAKTHHTCIYIIHLAIACNGKIQLTIYCTCLGNKMIHKDYAQVHFLCQMIH